MLCQVYLIPLPQHIYIRDMCFKMSLTTEITILIHLQPEGKLVIHCNLNVSTKFTKLLYGKKTWLEKRRKFT